MLDAVNEVLQNPPDGCGGPIDPIPHVEEKHRWSKADIQEVRDKLIQTCPEITFSDMPELWKQSVIDEINEALAEAWCDCCDPFEELLCGFGQTFTVITFTPSCDLNVNGFGDCRWNFAPVINGLQVGEPGYDGRSYQLIRRNKYTGEFAMSVFPGGGSFGTIDCDGRVVCNADTSGMGGAKFTDDGPEFGPAHFFDLRLRCNEFNSEFLRIMRRCCDE